MGKSTRSRVLQGGVGLCRAPRGRDGARKFSLSCRAGRRWGKTKSCEAGMKTPSFSPVPLPSLPEIGYIFSRLEWASGIDYKGFFFFFKNNEVG